MLFTSLIKVVKLPQYLSCGDRLIQFGSLCCPAKNDLFIVCNADEAENKCILYD